MRRYRLQNREGDQAEVRLDGLSIDGELHGDPLRVYRHLLPPKAPSTAAEAEAAVVHLLRGLASSGWKVTHADEDGAPIVLPGLAKAPPEDAGWRALGINPAALEEVVIDADPEDAEVRPATLMRDPRLERTRRLWIWHWGSPQAELDYRPWVKAFVARRWPALRSLSIGHSPDRYRRAVVGPITAEHWDAAPALEEVDVTGVLPKIERFAAPSLRKLIVVSAQGSPKLAEGVLGSRYPLLETLVVDLAEERDGVPIATLRPFLERTDLPQLRRVHLGVLRGGRGLVASLLGARWLPGLQELAIDVQAPDDADRQALADAAPRLVHLEKLRLSESLRPPPGLHPRLELSKRFPA